MRLSLPCRPHAHTRGSPVGQIKSRGPPIEECGSWRRSEKHSYPQKNKTKQTHQPTALTHVVGNMREPAESQDAGGLLKGGLLCQTDLSLEGLPLGRAGTSSRSVGRGGEKVRLGKAEGVDHRADRHKRRRSERERAAVRPLSLCARTPVSTQCWPPTPTNQSARRTPPRPSPSSPACPPRPARPASPLPGVWGRGCC
jgi:hypothetical protein